MAAPVHYSLTLFPAGASMRHRAESLRLGNRRVSAPGRRRCLAGRVVECMGDPLSRAEIRITRPHAAGIVAETETDANGRFRTPDLPDAEHILRFSKTSYVTVETATRARSEMLLRLVRCGAIAGKIADSEGRPVPYAQVVALTPSDAIAGTVDQRQRGRIPHLWPSAGKLPGSHPHRRGEPPPPPRRADLSQQLQAPRFHGRGRRTTPAPISFSPPVPRSRWPPRWMPPRRAHPLELHVTEVSR